MVVGAREALARTFVARFEGAARATVAARGRFAWALPGGSVAETFLPPLAAADVDWARVDFFWGDERAVAPEDPDSNYGLARRLLLERVPADPLRVHRMQAEEPDLEAAARGYEDELAGTLGVPPRLDLVLLGVGPEGHVCSLFPGHAALAERARRVVPIRDSPKPPPRRLTLTLPALATAGMLWVAAFGAEKAAVIDAALRQPASPLPVARALRAGPPTLLLLDPAAGAGIAPSAPR